MKTVYINHFNPITPENTNNFMRFVNTVIKNKNPDELYFLFASSGGNVDAGIVLYNFLKSLQNSIKITMHNFGSIDSIANTVYMGVPNRYAVKTASFLFHGITWTFSPQVGQYLHQIKEAISQVQGLEKKITGIISEHTELKEEELLSMFQQGESKNVEFALEKKIISEIKNIEVPKGAIHLTMNFNKYPYI